MKKPKNTKKVRVMSRDELKDAGSKMKDFSSILIKLAKLGFRTNNPVGEYGEQLAAKAFELTLDVPSNAYFDAKKDDVTYQIKCRRIAKRSTKDQFPLSDQRELGGFIFEKDPLKEPFEILIAILFDESMDIQMVLEIPYSELRSDIEDYLVNQDRSKLHWVKKDKNNKKFALRVHKDGKLEPGWDVTKVFIDSLNGLVKKSLAKFD